MNTFDAVGTIAGLFLLRLGLPIMATVGLAWWLKRMDNRWQAEARAQYIARHWGETDAAGRTVRVEPPAMPCWITRNCTEEQRAACAAHGQSSLPCWVVRLRREGKLPHTCLTCELFAVVRSGVGLVKTDEKQVTFG